MLIERYASFPSVPISVFAMGTVLAGVAKDPSPRDPALRRRFVQFFHVSVKEVVVWPT